MNNPDIEHPQIIAPSEASELVQEVKQLIQAGNPESAWERALGR